MKTLKLDNADMTILLAEVLELFEDFIEEHGGLINNPERDEAIATRQDDPDCIAHIYGMDYGDLENNLEILLDQFGVTREEA